MMVREISQSVGAVRESTLDELWSAALTLAEIASGVEGGALDLPEVLAAVGFYGPLPERSDCGTRARDTVLHEMVERPGEETSALV